jgi:hypothetical protein
MLGENILYLVNINFVTEYVNVMKSETRWNTLLLGSIAHKKSSSKNERYFVKLKRTAFVNASARKKNTPTI